MKTSRSMSPEDAATIRKAQRMVAAMREVFKDRAYSPKEIAIQMAEEIVAWDGDVDPEEPYDATGDVGFDILRIGAAMEHFLAMKGAA